MEKKDILAVFVSNQHSNSSKVVIIILVCQMRTSKIKLFI